MGTRSHTKVYDGLREADDTKAIITMYRQFDGYPSGHGTDLADFLEGMVVVNGISGREPVNFANGAGCLAAQLVKHFKEDKGGIYLYHPDTESKWIDYTYHIYAEPEQEIQIAVQGYHDEIFFGPLSEYVEKIRANTLEPSDEDEEEPAPDDSVKIPAWVDTALELLQESEENAFERKEQLEEILASNRYNMLELIKRMKEKL